MLHKFYIYLAYIYIFYSFLLIFVFFIVKCSFPLVNCSKLTYGTSAKGIKTLGTI